VAATATLAEKVPGGWRLSGEKTYISNGGIADVYTVIARTGGAPGAKGLSAFLMPADAAGLSVVERIAVLAPHPLARLRLDGVVLPEAALIGAPGQGFKVAMTVLDHFRPTVGAAALGFARRALDEVLGRVARPRAGGGRLADHQMVRGHVADIGLAIDAAALLVYRAAWAKDSGAARISREAAMAKLHATEAASRVIDMAVQLFGGDGVRQGFAVESLYREIRALRIYEGASDVQRLVIARAMMEGQE
jgi:acyl-CoA dehydrogenase